MTAPLPTDPRVEQILEVFAREARVDRRRLNLQARADQLGMSAFDLSLTLFELEDRFDVDMAPLRPGDTAPTVQEIVLQVLELMDLRNAALK